VGVEFYGYNYSNQAFPQKYHGAFFMADWAIGVIFAVHLERDGASYKGKVERFCTGAPMNVTDVITGPEGSLYFTLGGRGTQGGVYRIVYRGPLEDRPGPMGGRHPQLLSAWGRAGIAAQLGAGNAKDFHANALDTTRSARSRIKSLTMMQTQDRPADVKSLLQLVTDKEPEVRAHAVMLLGVNNYKNKESEAALLKALQDQDALVRRRTCEALIRLGIEPPVDAVWPLLNDKDRFARTAARLVLERIEPKKWAERVWKEKNEHIAFEGIVALCKIHQAAPYAGPIFQRLTQVAVREDQDAVPHLLDYLRTVQLALIHTTERPASVRALAKMCGSIGSFLAHPDWRVNRELAILMTHFRREKLTPLPVQARLLGAMLNPKSDRQQQIHYFYCLRLLHEGWTPQQKGQLLAWYEQTRDWTGGHSFTPFLENILRDLGPIFTAADRQQMFARAESAPWATAALLRMTPPEQLPSAQQLGDLYQRLTRKGSVPRGGEIKEAILTTLANSKGPDAQAALRQIGDSDPSQRDVVARLLARAPSPENWPYLVRGLQSTNPQVLGVVIRALRQIPTRPPISAEPRAEDAAPYRWLLLASNRLDVKERWQAAELLRHWGGRKFSPDEGDWKRELTGWSQWFAQTFPQEPPLPDVTALTPQSKWKLDELLAFLEKDPKGRTGDVQRGRVVFEKANCLKCHKFGKEGEGLGPDLTTLKSRFKRADTLEALLHPSKVISDQYRGSTIETRQGLTITGLAAVQGDTITVLQLDGTKVTLKTNEIQQQVASTISPMPEKLLDELTLQEIADLFAYMESEPPK
jgi:putative heme-binding domain-containing protein